ncbi:PREDICTED: glycerophosphocholine phosphodiesterase GPCPD1-like isoform X2 [Priapulus caudatus]|uniref:Glycerophosphocholine phosphodiesterase GPCPD1-like isoform X2 n=1 Tax=Priapulus caudatus TaxID=37621 RepID=A0ABM1DNT0_PRICU|nr:PREDICTED: glycerophosphocholine phosphodiesterase GPCPD1-like isoform X2 [Priapulus caudatus]
MHKEQHLCSIDIGSDYNTTIMNMVDVAINVTVDTNPLEVVCIVGGCAELGNWKPQLAVQLQKQEGVQRESWTCVVSLVEGAIIEYRYMVAVFVDLPPDESNESGDHVVVVKKWETFVRPRTICPKAGAAVLEEFGNYGGNYQVGPGWLTGLTEVRLDFKNNPIHMWKTHHKRRKYMIKVTAMDLRHKEHHGSFDDEDDSGLQALSGPCSDVLISVLNSEDDYIYRQQEQFGRLYEVGDYIVFKAHTFCPTVTAFTVDFYEYNPFDDTSIPEHKGFAYILPMTMKDMHRISHVPITGVGHIPLGQLTVEYLVVTPLPSQLCNMRTTYKHHWKRTRRPLDVGHRGVGSSYVLSGTAVVRENTIASLNKAGSHGADFVEFDVQLSKDLVPIVFHDFTVCIAMKKRRNTSISYGSHGRRDSSEQDDELYKIPVKDLTVAQLQQLKLSHSEHTQMELHTDEENISLTSGCSDGSNDIDFHDDNCSFATLEETLKRVNIHVGFNIEVKYPMETVGGTKELDVPYFEKNLYTDALLKTVLEHGGTRRIILSTFEPDIAIMMQLKQHTYPVMLLTMGDTTGSDAYTDIRTHCISMSVNFSICEKLLGMCVYMGDVETQWDKIEEGKNAGLVLFGWGVDEYSQVNHLKESGLDGVIFDRINEFKNGVDHQANVFMIESREKMRRQLAEEGKLIKHTHVHDSTDNSEPEDVEME